MSVTSVGRNERTNVQLVNAICSILDEKIPSFKSDKELITFVEDSASHNRHYAIEVSLDGRRMRIFTLTSLR